MRRFFAAIKDYFIRTDLFLLLIAVVTSAYGMLLISSAVHASGNIRPLIVQGIAVVLGIVAYIFLTLFDLEHLSFLWKAVFVGNLLLLATTLFWGVGMQTTGNNSWIRFSLGGVETGFQPAELGKILFVFTLAKHFQVLGEDINRLRGLIMLALHCVIPVAFVYLFSRDDGMALSYLFIFVIMAFAGGIYLRYCAVGLAGVAAAAPLVWAFVLGQYQRDRFIVLFDRTYKLDSVGYHQHQSLAAIQSGGLRGDGLYQGTVTQFGYLPAKQTDFIFSVACEELGFFGGFLIIVLLCTIIGICVAAALKMRDDKFSMLMCIGIAAMLTFQTFINIGMNLGIAPVVGLTLPLISYGGTSVVTMFIALGIVASLKKHYTRRTFL